jgi:salicylate hydroxylase
VLVQEAERLGVDLRLNSEIGDINFETTRVSLRNGDEISGDVIIAADGE